MTTRREVRSPAVTLSKVFLPKEEVATAQRGHSGSAPAAPPPGPAPGPRPAPRLGAERSLAAPPRAGCPLLPPPPPGPQSASPTWKAGPRGRSPAEQPWRQRRGGGSIRERRAARARSPAPPSCRPGGRWRERGRGPHVTRGGRRGPRWRSPGGAGGCRGSRCPLRCPRCALAPGPRLHRPFSPWGRPGPRQAQQPPPPRPARGQSRLWGDQSRDPRNSGWGRRAPGPRRTLCPQRTRTPRAPPSSSRGLSKRNRTWILVILGRLTPYPKNVRIGLSGDSRVRKLPFQERTSKDFSHSFAAPFSH